MTINDNTTKINTIKNTTLPELLQKINSLPDAGSGGGSAVETCTVTVTFTGLFGGQCYAIQKDDVIAYNEFLCDPQIEMIITDVFCNSQFEVDTSHSIVSVESIDGTSYLHGLGYAVIGTSDTTITVGSSSGNDNPWG